MGYNTDFEGQIKVEPVFDPDQVAYLQAFARSARMSWHRSLIEDVPDPLREAVELPLGERGDYFLGHVWPDNTTVGGGDVFGQFPQEGLLIGYEPPGQQVKHTEFGHWRGDGGWEPCGGGQQRGHLEYGDHTSCTDQRDVVDALEYRSHRRRQPGGWCQWTVTDDGQYIEWDYGEKFYHYEAWLAYVLYHFVKRWGRCANGDIDWRGEEPDDMGRLQVRNNELTVLRARVTYVKEV